LATLWPLAFEFFIELVAAVLSGGEDSADRHNRTIGLTAQRLKAGKHAFCVSSSLPGNKLYCRSGLR
jgi:hypothetical protein